MLDVYSAIIWNCFLRSQEIHASVYYPTDIDDVDVAPETLAEPGVSWLKGWRFGLDLYRILEYAMSKTRAKKPTLDSRLIVYDLELENTA